MGNTCTKKNYLFFNKFKFSWAICDLSGNPIPHTFSGMRKSWDIAWGPWDVTRDACPPPGSWAEDNERMWNLPKKLGNLCPAAPPAQGPAPPAPPSLSARTIPELSSPLLPCRPMAVTWEGTRVAWAASVAKGSISQMGGIS